MCGPAIYVAVVASSIVALVVVAAICAVALAHRERMRAVRRDPFLGPDLPAHVVDRYRQVQN